MVGGTTRFYKTETFDMVLHKHQEQVPERTLQVIEIAKKHGEIFLGDMAAIMGMRVGAVRMAVENATTHPGSRLYEDYRNGKIVIGWLK